MNSEDDQLLTVPEVAAYLRIDPESTRRWLREGKLLGINLGRGSGWRIRRGDLVQFLAEHYSNGNKREVFDGHSRVNGHGKYHTVGEANE